MVTMTELTSLLEGCMDAKGWWHKRVYAGTIVILIDGKRYAIDVSEVPDGRGLMALAGVGWPRTSPPKVV